MAYQNTQKNKRILLVDDEPDIMLVCKKGLSKHFKVRGFTDPEEALVHFKQNSGGYDLALTDVRMPKLSGFELAKEIRRIRLDIPILFMSAFEIIPSEPISEYPSFNKSHVITKPISINRLEQIVTQHLMMTKR